MESATQAVAANHVVSSQVGKPSFTHLGDWVWMSDAPDHAIRVYLAIRAYVFDKDEDWTITLTDAEIAALTKRSIDSVARARKACYKHGLLVELERRTRSIWQPGKKHQLRTERTILVNHEPPAGFAGPTNCFTEIKRLRAEGLTSTSQHSSDPADVRTQTDQGKRGNLRKAPGHSDPADLPETSADLPETSADLPETSADLPIGSANTPDGTPFDQGKRTPYLPSSLAYRDLPVSPDGPPPQRDEPVAAGSGETAPQEPSGKQRKPDPLTEQARTLAAEWWERQHPRPSGARAWHALVAVVKGALKVGWTREQILRALNQIGTVPSSRQLDMTLKGRNGRPAPANRYLNTDPAMEEEHRRRRELWDGPSADQPPASNGHRQPIF